MKYLKNFGITVVALIVLIIIASVTNAMITEDSGLKMVIMFVLGLASILVTARMSWLFGAAANEAGIGLQNAMGVDMLKSPTNE